MLRILVADDEPRQRKVLAGILRKFRPADDIVECKNGEEALEKLHELPIDAIFTDIRMPRVDGLQLIEEMTHKPEKIKTVIVSGYNNFEYAQRAVTLGAYDYILKPIEESRIQQIISKIEKDIETEKRHRVRDVELTRQLSQTMPAYSEYLMNKWVAGSLTNTQQKELIAMLPQGSPGLILCTVVYPNACDGTVYTEDEMAELEQNIRYWMDQQLSCIGHCVSFNWLQRERIVLTALFPDGERVFSEEGLVQELQLFASGIRKEYRANIAIGMSELDGQMLMNAPDACAKAEKASEFRLYAGAGSVIRYCDIKGSLSRQSVFVQFAEENTLSEAIAADDRSAVQQAIGLIFGRILSIYQPEVETLKNMLSRIIVMQAYNFRAMMENELFNELVLTIKTGIDHARPETVQDLKTLCVSAAGMIMDMRCTCKNTRHESVINRCLEYIDEHFAEDISLETLSRQFFFNPSYFSIYFKKYTKLKLSDYLPAVRINKAKELLVNTDQKIYEIANHVGYRDSRYFNQIFKKLNHVTPAEYRKYHSIQSEGKAR